MFREVIYFILVIDWILEITEICDRIEVKRNLDTI